MIRIMQSKDRKITFEQFLSGMPARDYIVQKTSYEEQIRQAAQLIKDADYVLMGAGAGMSAAAGARYGGQFFKDHFGEFIEKYGGPYMQDMYSAGFYPYPDEESKWGYWSKHALLGGADQDVTPLHRELLKALEGKKSFLLSTNVDDQFLRAGYPADQIFATQGSYSKIQCKKGCHPKIYDGVEMFRQMDQARKDCKVPSFMVPKCPVCGGPMEMNLRCDQYFVQDETWYEAEKRFGNFLSECIPQGHPIMHAPSERGHFVSKGIPQGHPIMHAPSERGHFVPKGIPQGHPIMHAPSERGHFVPKGMDKKTVLLELGVGFNTPTIIRFPFEKLVREHKNISLVRLNLNEAVVPESFGDRTVGINADMAQSIRDIVKAVWKE